MLCSFNMITNEENNMFYGGKSRGGGIFKRNERVLRNDKLKKRVRKTKKKRWEVLE